VPDTAKLKHNIPISITALMTRFDCPRLVLKVSLEHALQPPPNQVKHSLLDRVRERQIRDWTPPHAESGALVMRKEITYYRLSHFQASIPRRWVNLFTLRWRDHIIHRKSVPQEKQNLQALELFLPKIVQNLNGYIQQRPGEPLFDFEEGGSSDSQARTTRKAIVVSTMEAETVHHRIS
jgi:hypothetical protein